MQAHPMQTARLFKNGRSQAEVFLQEIRCLPWTSATTQAYADLRARMEKQGVCLSSMDLLIATHALAEGCTLVSADRAFAQVPELRVLDWTALPTK